MSRKRLMAAGVATFLLSSMGVLVGVPAQATTNYGCVWPRVCFYLNSSDWAARTPTAAYQDMGYWQTLGSSSRGSFMVYNSRNDDGALLKFADGHTFCLRPNVNADVGYDGVVTDIMIMNSESCA